MTWLVSLVLAALPEVSVTVAPGVVCLQQRALVERLERSGLTVTVRRSTRLHVEVRLEGAALTVRGVRPGATMERVVPARVDDCVSVERVVAALVQSWAQLIRPLEEPRRVATRRELVDAGALRAADQPTARATEVTAPAIRLELENGTESASAVLGQTESGGVAAAQRKAPASRSVPERRADSVSGSGAADQGALEVRAQPVAADPRSSGAAERSTLAARAQPVAAVLQSAQDGSRSGSSGAADRSALEARAQPVAAVLQSAQDDSRSGPSGAADRSALEARAQPVAPDLQSAQDDSRSGSSTSSANTPVDQASSRSPPTVPPAVREDRVARPAEARPGLAVPGSSASPDAEPESGSGVSTTSGTQDERVGRSVSARPAPLVASAAGSRASSRDESGRPRAGRASTEQTSTLAVAAGPDASEQARLRSEASAAADQAASGAARTAVASIAPVSPPGPWLLDLFLGGGGVIGPTASVTGAGAFGLTLMPGRFGVGLDVGLESQRSGRQEPALVVSDAQWLSLRGVVQFDPTERLLLRASLGLRGFRLSATSSGVLEAGTSTVFSFGGVVAGELAFRLVGRFFLQLFVFGSLRVRTDRFIVEGLEPVLVLNPGSLGLLGGLSWRGVGE